MEEQLRESACFGDIDGMMRLLRSGVDVNAKHKINGWTALHWAAKRNNVKGVEALIKAGADQNITNNR